MHKQPLLILVVSTFLLCIASTSVQAGWFDNQQNQQLEYQLNQAHQENDGAGIVILVLAVCVVISLGVGAAVGSKARRSSKQREQ